MRRLAWHRFGLAAALLALTAGTLAGGFAHVDGLHSQRFGPERELSSGCSAQHPASFEPLLTSRTVDCPACLLQLQQHAATPAPAVVAALAARSAERAIQPQAPRGRTACRLAAPRGPPAA